MPVTDKMICIRRGDVSYCWNFDTCQVEIYTKKTAGINDCPKDVADNLILLLNQKAKERE